MGLDLGFEAFLVLAARLVKKDEIGDLMGCSVGGGGGAGALMGSGGCGAVEALFGSDGNVGVDVDVKTGFGFGSMLDTAADELVLLNAAFGVDFDGAFGRAVVFCCNDVLLCVGKAISFSFFTISFSFVDCI